MQYNTAEYQIAGNWDSKWVSYTRDQCSKQVCCFPLWSKVSSLNIIN